MPEWRLPMWLKDVIWTLLALAGQGCRVKLLQTLPDSDLWRRFCFSCTQEDSGTPTFDVKAAATFLPTGRACCGGSLATRWHMIFTQHSASAGGRNGTLAASETSCHGQDCYGNT